MIYYIYKNKIPDITIKCNLFSMKSVLYYGEQAEGRTRYADTGGKI